jgi:nucleoside-diphosphate-sugar epimerase
MEQVNCLNGAFLDGIVMPGAVIAFDDQAGTATFWGSGDVHFEATTVDDTARYAARVALDPEVPAGRFAIAAERISYNEIVAANARAAGRR